MAFGALGGEYFSLGAGTDIAPLLKGLEGDACQAPHWGYMLKGRMIVGYTDRSKHSAEIDSTNWPRILSEKGVEVGRPDPNTAPAGYRTLLMLQLAEDYYHQRGLAQRVLANAPPKN